MKAWQVWALQSRLARWSRGQEPGSRPKATSYEFWRLCELGRVLSHLRPNILNCKCDQHFTAPGIIFLIPSEIYTEGPTRWLGGKRSLQLKSDTLSSNPGTYIVKGQNWLLQVFSDVHVCVMAHMYPCTCTRMYTQTDDRYTHKQNIGWVINSTVLSLIIHAEHVLLWGIHDWDLLDELRCPCSYGQP